TIRIGVRSAEHRQGDLGYAVHPDHWGKGFATEALRRILEFGFENLSLERIWATADVRNVASWRVMEKAGMEREGLMRTTRVSVVRGGILSFMLASTAYFKPIRNDCDSTCSMVI